MNPGRRIRFTVIIMTRRRVKENDGTRKTFTISRSRRRTLLIGTGTLPVWGLGGEAPQPPEATGAKRNSYNSKIENFAVQRRGGVDREVNSPVRPEGRTPA